MPLKRHDFVIEAPNATLAGAMTAERRTAQFLGTRGAAINDIGGTQQRNDETTPGDGRNSHYDAPV